MDDQFDKAVKLKCAVGAGTMGGLDPDTGNEVDAGYLLIMHDSFPIPLVAVLSVEMATHIRDALNLIIPQITMSSPVNKIGSDDGRYTAN